MGASCAGVCGGDGREMSKTVVTAEMDVKAK